MEKELLFEDTKYIKARKQEIEKKVFAINTVLDALMEKVGCVLSNEEIGGFVSSPDDLFEIVCRNLIRPNDVRVEVIKQTISERLEPIIAKWKLLNRGLDNGFDGYILLQDGRASLNEEEFEKAMDAHRTMLDSEPRKKAWAMAQKIVSDINKLEKYLSENALGRVQPHAIGINTTWCNSYLIHYSGNNDVKLEPKAVGCIK